MSNPFPLLYSTYSNLQLLEIIENGKDYQPIALEAAKAELESRKLSEGEIAETKKVLETKQQEVEQQREASLVFQKKVQEVSAKVAHELNPTTQKSHEFVIKLLCIYLGLDLLWATYSKFYLIKYLFFTPQPFFDPSFLLLFIPFAYVPVTIIFFYKKTKIGWSLYVIMLAFALSFALISFFQSLYVDDTYGGLFPEKPTGTYIMPIVLCAAQLIYINTQPLREIFSVSLGRQFVSFAIPVLVALFMQMTLPR